MGLRLQIKPPAGSKADNGNSLTLGDLYDTTTSAYVQYAAQFADYIRMSVSGVVLDGTEAPPQFCPKAPSTSADGGIALVAEQHKAGAISKHR